MRKLTFQVSRTLRNLFGCVILLYSAMSRGAAAEIHVPLLKAPPTIDGVIRPAEWIAAYRIDGFGWNGALERRRASGYIGADSTHLYIAIRSQLPDEGALLSEVRRSSENLVYDDSVEIWIEPTFGQERGRRLQLMMNSAGFTWYKLHPYGGVPEDPGWQGGWQIASKLHDGVWDCEVSIPLDRLTPGRKAQDGVWGINICRNWKQEWAWSSLSGGGYAPTEGFVFGDSAPAVQFEQSGDPFTGKIEDALTISNTTPGALELKGGLDLERDVMPPIKMAAPFRLSPGETRRIPLTVTDASTRKFGLTAMVTSADGKTVYFQHRIGWPAAASPAPYRWVAHKKVIPPVDMQFAYYPSRNQMKIMADVSNMPKDAEISSLTATVRTLAGKEIKTVRFDHLIGGKQEALFSLPALNGRYEIAMAAIGKRVPDQPVVKQFERTVFPWENGSLGKTHKVYAPFTPMRVAGDRVSTVLREHTMGMNGLWKQVNAAGSDLLAGPMRFDFGAEGHTDSVTPARLAYAHIAADRVEMRTGFRVAGINAEVASGMDYDGAMRVDLTLPASPGKAIDGLTLVIPLKAEAATLLHAMGDGIRNTLSMQVPGRDGVIWSSRQVQSDDLPPGFCTYLYVGTAKRGLCWFAENDRDWSWDPKSANVELVRHGATVEMRVNLINRPLVMKTARTISFGLLAAPVKPRLSPDWRYKYRRDNYALLGTDINWLALGDCGSVYPAGKDVELWRMIAKANQTRLSEDEIKAVVDRGKPYFLPYGEERTNTFINHAHYNLTSHLDQKMIFYYNRASYPAAEEYETFKDEWGLSNYRTSDKNSGIGEIKIVPSPSYIDHALYWYGKSFDIGRNRGVYWDNWFFVGTYNTAFGGAYPSPDGSVTPSTGIWGLRELEKRTFQYMNELGLPPITMPHMTSTSILPMLSFATVQYDWEWKYSEGDVQGRFPREYILLASDGELAGTWPVVLGEHGKQENDAWTGRTFAAVCMLHELDCSYSAFTDVGKMQRSLFRPIDAILTVPGVRTYRYWDDAPQPVHTSNNDLPSIVYTVPGKETIAAIVSYANKDEIADITIDLEKLGFSAAARVQNVETGELFHLQSGHISVPVKRHDLLMVRISNP